MIDSIWTNNIVDLYQGDCREVLAALPAQSVHCVVTSPPYWGLRDYGIEPSIWYPGGLVNACKHEWSIKQHIDKRGVEGTGLNGRDPYKGGEARQSYDEGGCLHCGAWLGNLGLEPRPELYVDHLVEIFRAVKRVLRDDGTLWLNLGDTYNANQGNGFDSNQDGGARKALTASPKLPSALPTKNLVGIPWRVAFALQADGWYLRSDIIWHKPNPMPESVNDRPTKSHEYLFLLTKSAKYYYDAEAIRESADPRSAERYRYDFSGTNGTDTVNDRRTVPFGKREFDGHRNKRTVWTIPTHPFPEAHFATFPEKIVEPCILAGSPKNGTILDPFIGSGTTAIVAQRLNRRCIGIDASETYLKDIAIKRITGVTLPMQIDV